jgi:hypothetical protein
MGSRSGSLSTFSGDARALNDRLAPRPLGVPLCCLPSLPHLRLLALCVATSASRARVRTVAWLKHCLVTPAGQAGHVGRVPGRSARRVGGASGPPSWVGRRNRQGLHGLRPRHGPPAGALLRASPQKIHIRALKLAHNSGQPCTIFVHGPRTNPSLRAGGRRKSRTISRTPGSPSGSAFRRRPTPARGRRRRRRRGTPGCSSPLPLF